MPPPHYWDSHSSMASPKWPSFPKECIAIRGNHLEVDMGWYGEVQCLKKKNMGWMICGFLCRSVPQNKLSWCPQLALRKNITTTNFVCTILHSKKKQKSASTRYFPGKNHLSQKQRRPLCIQVLTSATLQQTFTVICQELAGVPPPRTSRCSRSGSG